MINVLTDVGNTDRLAGLRRERPANKLIGDLYFETMVAIDARKHLVALPRDFSSIGNMDVLFGFTACASTVITRSRFSGIIESLCHIIPRTACWLTGVASFSPSLIFGRCGRATDAKEALRNTGMSVYLPSG